MTVTECIEQDVFRGRVLNQPHALQSIQAGSMILFIAPGGSELLMVSPQYLVERDEWIITPCNKCGLDGLFDPPSTLLKGMFPDIPEARAATRFTAFCGLCGGVQVISKAGRLAGSGNRDGAAAPLVGILALMMETGVDCHHSRCSCQAGTLTYEFSS